MYTYRILTFYQSGLRKLLCPADGGLRHAVATPNERSPPSFRVAKLRRGEGGDDVPKLEPIRSLHYTRVDRIVRDLRRIYKDNPASFDIPAFAVKVY